jgi:hypothetical protein
VEDALPSLLVLMVATASLAMRRFDRSVAPLVWGALVAHWLSAAMQILITKGYYGGGDMLGYFEVGRALADLMQLDPVVYVPEVATYFLQGRVSLPVGQLWEGSSTGSMAAAAAFILLVSGSSLWAACLVTASLAFFGKLALYDVLRERLPPGEHRRAAVAMLLLPSAVFWVSGLVKESLTVTGMCLLIAGAYRAWRGRVVLGALGIVCGGLFVAMLKPYVLFPTCAGVTVWLYWQRALVRTRGGPVRLRPALIVLAVGSAIGVIVALGQLFPDYAVDHLAEEVAHHQGMSAYSWGGSSIEVGDPSEKSVAGQLAFAPLGIANVVLRPFFFEVRNSVMAMSAVETTGLLVAIVTIALRRRWRRVADQVLMSPEIVFCLVVSFTMAIGVGLATSNLGTLSRYRVPMMPFLALGVLLLVERAREPRGVGARLRAPSSEGVRRTAGIELPRPASPRSSTQEL